MRIVNGFLSFALCWAILSSTAGATIILSFNPTNSLQVDSGIQKVAVFANSTVAAGEAGNAIGADFTLSGVGGAAANRAIFANPAGEFALTGFLGAGNVAVGSTFNRGTANQSLGLMNINFNPGTVVAPSTRIQVANLLINTSGLALGSYNISTANGFFGNGDVSNATGSFTITAVPEPTSIAMIGLAIGGIFVRRVLRVRQAVRANGS